MASRDARRKSIPGIMEGDQGEDAIDGGPESTRSTAVPKWMSASTAKTSGDAPRPVARRRARLGALTPSLPSINSALGWSHESRAGRTLLRSPRVGSHVQISFCSASKRT